MSLLSAAESYPSREVPLNYNTSLLFHGGDTGSTPVRDANILINQTGIPTGALVAEILCHHHLFARLSRAVQIAPEASCYRVPTVKLAVPGVEDERDQQQVGHGIEQEHTPREEKQSLTIRPNR